MSPSGHHLRAILRRRDFRRLFATRLSSQFADGIFQAGLAGSVLFNPDRQTKPLAVALGFASLLLPYSVVGPFAGVLLDRWSRRNVLVAANLVRPALVPFIATMVWFGREDGLFMLFALIAIGVNRFFLSGLSASLRHVAQLEHLATANSLSTTSGSIVFSLGVGAAVALRTLTGADNHGYAIVALCSVVGYLLSSAMAAGFKRDQLGPDAAELASRSTVRDVARGLVLGYRHLQERRGAGQMLLVTSAHRLFFGILMIATLLLYRNYFEADGFFRTGATGLGQTIAASAIGAFIAASVTPWAIRTLTARVWVSSLLLLTAVVELLLGAPYATQTLLPAVLVVGLAAQGVKIVADTTLQAECDDEYQGRVFSLYDMTFNVSLVCGLLLGALILPATGKSYAVLGFVAGGYACTAGWYAWASGRWRRGHPSPIETPAATGMRRQLNKGAA
jgi:MFS family permease